MEYNNNNAVVSDFSNIDIFGMVKDTFNNIAVTVDNLHHLNIMLVGISGVGKSTLINKLFRENLAKTGSIEPVTQNINKYTKPHYPLTVYDTRGFELEPKTLKSIKKQLMENINLSARTNNPDDVIHCVLYCINAGSRRIEPEEIEFIKSLTDDTASLRVPTIIVLTQAYSRKYMENMKNYIDALSLNVKAVVPILAEDFDIGNGECIEHYGLDNLAEKINDTLSGDLKKTLSNVQQANLDLKIKRAKAIINASVIESGAAALNPIPISDAIVLTGIETKMIGEITVVFGLTISKSIISAFISTSLGTNAATIGGRTVASALKLIPGIGTAAGISINMLVATSITKAMGESYIQLMIAIVKNEIKASDLNTESGMNKLFAIIDDQFRKQKDEMDSTESY